MSEANGNRDIGDGGPLDPFLDWDFQGDKLPSGAMAELYSETEGLIELIRGTTYPSLGAASSTCSKLTTELGRRLDERGSLRRGITVSLRGVGELSLMSFGSLADGGLEDGAPVIDLTLTPLHLESGMTLVGKVDTIRLFLPMVGRPVELLDGEPLSLPPIALWRGIGSVTLNNLVLLQEGHPETKLRGKTAMVLAEKTGPRPLLLPYKSLDTRA